MQEHHPDRVEVVPCTDGWAVSVKADHVFLNHGVVRIAHDAAPDAQRYAIRSVLASWGLEIPADAPWRSERDGSYLLPLTDLH